MDDSNEERLSHVVPVKVLLAVFAALIALTGLTVFLGRFDVGEFDIVVAMAVASIKAALVALYFMHLRHDRALNGILLVGSVLFVLLFVALAVIDSGEYRENLRPVPTTAPGQR